MSHIQFDHVIHHIENLDNFNYPGDILALTKGGKHQNLGTYNVLSHIDLRYIEYLDVYNMKKLKEVSKTEEQKHSFAATLVHESFSQGFKRLCFRTDDIEQLKEEMLAEGLIVTGPLEMSRVSNKGQKITWKLLYINDKNFNSKLPFFIQWDQPESERQALLEDKFQKHLSISAIKIESPERDKIVKNWQKWFKMTFISENDDVSVLETADGIQFEITDAKVHKITTVVLKDKNIEAPFLIRVRAGNYRFEPYNS
ncbi:VOC family protein [Staphylococcus massiliensis]|uniref:Glyoxalase-like domain-containing protein n=1 Tax=Staphylococcus massiliensis S46 TaxID=1229783 RepID=K9ANS8_9STAP|nr:VOC family protein [Staphylococcus massiliensis]EKU48939.1 hypothetical protein C273_04010 [Staphylococcus massiliensis S46]